jgi:hypothetical protein
MDAVYTWVDASNETTRSSRVPAGANAAAIDAGAHRYRDNGELRYSLRSLHQHAPWIERIFVVTNGQWPSWLDRGHPRIKHVTHDQIFTDPSNLPTFNSCAIEAHLHRIEGLSERFLYLNDDFFLGAPLAEGDLWSASGAVRLHLSLFVVPEGDSRTIVTIYGVEMEVPEEVVGTSNIYNGAVQQVNAAFDRKYGKQKRRYWPHVPWPFERSTLRDLERDWEPEIARTASHRFRAIDDFMYGHAYAQYLLATRPAEVEVIDCFEWTIPTALESTSFATALDALGAERPKFFCLQDDALADEAKLERLRGFLAGYFPGKAPWELD